MLRLAVFLLVCAAVRAREMECDKFSKNRFCWNSTTHQNPICLICEIKNQQLFESDEVIYLNHPHNYFDAVRFSGGNMTKMPNLIQIKDNKDILGVKLLGTKIPVLNSQFFGNAGENWTSFQYYSDNNLTVKAFAFQNCKSLESLVLKSNKSSSIFEPDAFRGLHKLIWLRLSKNDLSLMLTDWFQDLANLDLLSLDKNKLAEIPDNAFKSLTKLTKLDLDRNRIEIITRNMFKHNAKLQRIDLQFNRISQIQSGSFAHLSQLTELNLEYNQCVSKEFINKTSDEIAERLTDCYPYTCVIPQIPNGIIVSIDDNSTQLPGELFDGSGSVKVNCNSTFTQIHDIANETTNRCLEGNWEDQQWPTCQKLCPRQEIIDKSFLASCDRDGEDFPCSNHLLPGIKAIIRCQSGYMNPKDLVNPELTCLESGNWSQSAHKCEKIKENVTEPSPIQSGVSCPFEEISGPSISTHCERNGVDLNCTDHLSPGTKVTIRCHFGYMKPNPFESELTCEESGNWSSKASECETICGRVSSHSIPLQIGGKDTNITEVPWHVGIYENDTQICGGTIISERVVISAAHCFSNSTDQKHNIDYKTFKVAAGKIVRGLDAKETQKTQIRNVLNVDISLKYDGFFTWYADIATVLIEGHFEYQLHIAPACVDFSENKDDWYPKSDSRARVAGWGLDKDFKSSDILQSFDIPVVDFESCEENAPVDFKTKVVEDKICAGFVDTNGNYSKVVCRGDSGGGLLIPQTFGNNKRYFLQGVVSNSQYTKDCDTSYYTLFTNIQHYKNLINKAFRLSKIPSVVTGQ